MKAEATTLFGLDAHSPVGPGDERRAADGRVEACLGPHGLHHVDRSLEMEIAGIAVIQTCHVLGTKAQRRGPF